MYIFMLNQWTDKMYFT